VVEALVVLDEIELGAASRRRLKNEPDWRRRLRA
jgi:hypothetical protein